MSAENHNSGARLASSATRQKRPRSQPHAPLLRDTEVAVIKAVAQGLLTKEIARSLGVCPRTVESRLGVAATTLAAANRSHLVALAIRAGIVAPLACSRLRDLTERELIVLHDLSHGLTAAMIADRHGIASVTVSARIRKAKTRTGAKTVWQLAALFASLETIGKPTRPRSLGPEGHRPAYPRIVPVPGLS